VSALNTIAEVPVLAGTRLTLRPMSPADAGDVWAYHSDPDVYGPTSLRVESPAQTERGVRELAAGFARGEFIRWGIVPSGTERVAGDCGFFNFEGQTAEVGYLLARQHWGQGIASEAVDLMLSFAFEELRLVEVAATVMEGNERSLRLLERKGFERLELLPGYRDVRGELKDFWLLRRAHEHAVS
jgi:ribosomal-protein-alanine N-acetyltransferase